MEQSMNYNCHIFGPFLWQTSITTELKNELLERGLSHHKNDHRHSLAGIIDKEYKYSNEDTIWFSKKITTYVNEYLKLGYHHYNTNDAMQGLKMVSLESLWINVMEKGESNPMHGHDGDISFVVYLDVPDELIQENEDYNGRSSGPGKIDFHYGEYQKHFISVYSFLPKTCDLLMFPANLKHSVNSYKSNVKRISISGNFKFIYE